LDEEKLNEMLTEAYMEGHKSIRGDGGAKVDHLEKFLEDEN